LEINDMNHSSEKANMIYVSYFFHLFRSEKPPVGIVEIQK